MAINIEALKLREIDREGKFEPFQFGTAAKSAVSTGLQVIQAQGQLADERTKREQAAMMQQLINGGQSALFAAIGKLEPEEQALIVGGDQNTLKSITDNPEGLVEGWKMLSEVLATKEGKDAPDFRGRVDIAARRGLVSQKEALTLTKPSAKKGEISNKVFLTAQQSVADQIKDLEQTPTKDQAFEIVTAVLNEKGIPLNDPGAAKLMQFALTASALPEKAIERERIDFQKSEARVKKITELSKTLKGSADQGNIFLGLAEDLDLFSEAPVNILNDKEFLVLQNKFVDTTPENLMSAWINEKLGASPKNKAEKELLRSLRKDPAAMALLNKGRLSNIMTKFAKLINVLTKDRSGAAVTPNELERIKIEFGIDLLGSPEQFKIGLINFGKDLKFSMEQVEAGTDPKAVGSFIKQGGFTSKDLNFSSGASKEIEDIDADLELLK